MDCHWRSLLIGAVIASSILSCSAQSAISNSGENASSDIHTSVVCLPGTNICYDPHINSVVTDSSEEFKPSTICNPITKVCRGPSPPGRSSVADSRMVEALEGDDASKSEPSIINLAIHGKDSSIDSFVCDKNGKCRDPHHGFAAIAEPRNEDL